MKKILNIGSKSVLILTISIFLSACKIETVSFVDVPRYMGLWYQISANPTIFSGDLVGVTAEYTLLDDGSVNVENRGFVGTLDGEEQSIVGNAVVFDEETNASLIVTFPGQPESPFPNYLIVVLDEIDYQYAVVTDPLMTNLFVLSRTPAIDEDLYQSILSELEAKEIDTSKLVLTPQ